MPANHYNETSTSRCCPIMLWRSLPQRWWSMAIQHRWLARQMVLGSNLMASLQYFVLFSACRLNSAILYVRLRVVKISCIQMILALRHLHKHMLMAVFIYRSCWHTQTLCICQHLHFYAQEQLGRRRSVLWLELKASLKHFMPEVIKHSQVWAAVLPFGLPSP